MVHNNKLMLSLGLLFSYLKTSKTFTQFISNGCRIIVSFHWYIGMYTFYSNMGTPYSRWEEVTCWSHIHSITSRDEFSWVWNLVNYGSVFKTIKRHPREGNEFDTLVPTESPFSLCSCRHHLYGIIIQNYLGFLQHHTSNDNQLT
jgi:hypothetical protein